MGIPIISSIIEAVTGTIDTIADKIAPDKNIEVKTEADLIKFKENLKAAVETELLKKAVSDDGFLMRDLEGARGHEIELARMEPPLVRYITGLLRGIFRPVIGFTTLGSFVWCRFLAPFWGHTRIVFDQYDYYVIGLIVTFYFGGRTIEKVKGASLGRFSSPAPTGRTGP